MKRQRIYVLLLSTVTIVVLLFVTNVYSTGSAYCRMLGNTGDNIIETLASRSNVEAAITVEPILNVAVDNVVGDAVFENEQEIVVATLDGRVFSIDVATGLTQEISFTGPSYITLLNPVKESQLGLYENTLSVWDLDSGAKTSEINTDSLSSVAISHDGNLIAYGDLFQTISLYDLSSSEPIGVFQAHNLPISIAFHPSNSLFAYGTHGDNDSLGDISVSVVDYETNEEVGLYRGHNRPITTVAFHPDVALLASASREGAIHLWEVCGDHAVILGQHSSEVTALAFSPNGDILISGDVAGNMVVWNVFSQQPTQHIDALDSPTTGIEFSPNGKLFLTYHVNQSVMVWRLSQ